MFLGILLAFALFGFVMFFGNSGRNTASTIARQVGLFCLLTGTFGATGWIIELLYA